MTTPVHVLLIEDHLHDASLIKEELQVVNAKTVVQLEWVDQLEKGLEYVVANHVDAVLLDLSLPDHQGLDVLRRVIARAPQIPVIVMTSQADEEFGMKAMRAGAQDYLVKGELNSQMLAHVIPYAIQRKRTELQLADALKFTERVINSSPIGIFTYRLSGEIG